MPVLLIRHTGAEVIEVINEYACSWSLRPSPGVELFELLLYIHTYIVKNNRRFNPL